MYSCVREMPSLAAALNLLSAQSVNRCAIMSRSTALKSVVDASTAAADRTGRCPAAGALPDQAAFTENRGALERIAELPYVSRPVVVDERLCGVA